MHSTVATPSPAKTRRAFSPPARIFSRVSQRASAARLDVRFFGAAGEIAASSRERANALEFSLRKTTATRRCFSSERWNAARDLTSRFVSSKR